MPSARTLRSKVLLAFLGPLALAVASALLVSRALERTLSLGRGVLQAEAVIAQATALERAAADAETGERGYLLTGQPEYLDPYERGVATFPSHAQVLETALRGRPDQLERLRRMRESFSAWKREVAEPALARRRRGAGSGESPAGKRLMDRLRAAGDELIARERDVRIAREQEAAVAVGVASALAFWGPTLSLLLALGIVLTAALRLVRGVRAVAATVRGLAGGDLTSRAAVGPGGEMGAMAADINTLAERLQAWTHEVALLRELSDVLQACRTRAEAFSVAPPLIERLFPGRVGALFRLSASRDRVERVATWGELPGPGGPSFPSEACWALRRGHPHRGGGGGPAPVCDHVTAVPVPGYLCVPLAAQGEVLGVLHLAESHGTLPGRPTDAEAGLAETVAERMALAVANLHLQESLREQSVRDPLTGLFNRRYMAETLERELHRVARHQRTLGVVLLDVDRFKAFNDRWGHEAGDLLLRELGRLLRTQLRQEDVACRYGGEEFVLLLPESAPGDTRRRAEQLRQDVERMTLKLRGIPLGQVSASFGIAVAPIHGTTAEGLLREADMALYAAKQAGRNRVEVAPVPATRSDGP